MFQKTNKEKFKTLFFLNKKIISVTKLMLKSRLFKLVRKVRKFELEKWGIGG